MRSFQMMRCGRRPLTSTGSELNESILHPNETASVSRHRNTMSTSNNSSRQNSFQYDEDEDVSIQRTYLTNITSIKSRFLTLMDSSISTTTTLNKRNVLNVQKCVPNLDVTHSTRRPSFNNGRRLSFQQQELTESSKSKTNLRNFYVFFVLLFLFIFLAVVYSFIRMIKNQSS